MGDNEKTKKGSKQITIMRQKSKKKKKDSDNVHQS